MGDTKYIKRVQKALGEYLHDETTLNMLKTIQMSQNDEILNRKCTKDESFMLDKINALTYHVIDKLHIQNELENMMDKLNASIKNNELDRSELFEMILTVDVKGIQRIMQKNKAGGKRKRQKTTKHRKQKNLKKNRLIKIIHYLVKQLF